MQRRFYYIFCVALSALVLSWFLPWIYSVAFPSAHNLPFVAYSPISRSFVVSGTDSTGEEEIYLFTDTEGRLPRAFTREQRDSLLPQIYFNQLAAHDRLPDTIDGKAMTMANIKHNQWVMSSMPRDILRVKPRVYLMMESMPARVDLEDPKVMFRVTGDSAIEFLDIISGETDSKKSREFSRVFADRGFDFPISDVSANITSRKPYDEGYLMIDNSGRLYHLKMQCGRPYMVSIPMPEGHTAKNALVMENTDRRHLGLVTDTDGRLYAIERDGYRLVELPTGGGVDLASDRLMVVANLFNFVVRVVPAESSARWSAFSADDYAPLGNFSTISEPTPAETIANYIFPFRLSFTSVDDMMVRPRFTDFSAKALWLNCLLALVTAIILWRRREQQPAVIISAGVTVFLGLFTFIPLTIIR